MGIRMNPPEFPEHRSQDPKRRAEAEEFDALQTLEPDGHGLCRFAVQVKGGRYEMDNTGRWTPCTPGR